MPEATYYFEKSKWGQMGEGSEGVEVEGTDAAAAERGFAWMLIQAY
jgi:hypothetical protein